MKNLIKSLALIAVSAFGAQHANGQTGYTYLGGAYNLAHCQQIAGSYGYQIATFGGYVNGVYYWNACLGSNYGGGNGGLVQKYDVYSTSDLGKCAEDIEWELGSQVRCRAQDSFIRCISNRGNVRSALEQVACVDRAYPQ